MRPVSRLVKWLFWLLFAAAAVVLAARTLLGPLKFVRSPMNAEGIIAIAAAVLIAMGSRTAASGEKGSAWMRSADLLMPASLVALIAAVFWGSRNDFFLADDFLLLKYAHDFTFDLHRLLTTPGGDGFFRPATNVFFGALFRWAQFDPLHWHFAGFAMHATNTLLVYAILRQMRMAAGWAWFGAALFAIHGTRPEAVVWVGGRFDLLATLFVLASIALFLGFLDLKSGWRWALWGSALVACALGILSKESAYAGPLILGVLAWARGRKPVAVVAPFFAVAAGLFAYRWVLFGSIGGYLDAAGRPQALGVTPLNAIKALAFRIWAVLVFPIDWNWAPAIWVGAAMVLYLGALAWIAAARVQRGALIAPLAFLLLAALPPLQQLLIGPDMEKARYLYLPGVGFCWLIALVLAAMKPVPGKIVAAAVLVFNFAALGNNLGAWHFVSQRARLACEVAAACSREGNRKLLARGLPRTTLGVPLFAFGFEECTRMAGGEPVAVANDGDPGDYACVLEWDAAKNELRRIE